MGLEDFLNRNKGYRRDSDFSKKNKKYKKELVKTDTPDDSKESESKDKFLDIWNNNPSYKDINTKLASTRTIFLVIIITFIALTSYLIYLDLRVSITLCLISLIFFLIILKNNIYSLENFLTFKFRKFSKINPFEKLIFWQSKNDLTTLFYCNKNDLTNVALKIFKLEILAENVSPNLNNFIKSMSITKIPYSYQVIQSPFIKYFKETNYKEDSHKHMNLSHTIKTDIYFTIFFSLNGILNKGKFNIIKRRINSYEKTMMANFDANFHHCKVILLSGNELINGLRTYIIKEDTQLISKDKVFNNSKKKVLSFLPKLILLWYLIGISISIFINLRFELTIIIGVIILESVFFILIWCKEFLFQFTKRRLNNNINILFIDPFNDIDFYYLKKTPSSLYLHINKNLLIDIKIFNLFQVSSKTYIYPDKLFRAAIGQKIPLCYTSIMSPIGFRTFNKEAFGYLYDIRKKEILNKRSIKDGEDWLQMRGGVFRTILTISVSSHKFVKNINYEDIRELEEILIERFNDVIGNVFKMEFSNYFLKKLYSKTLISGLMCGMLKNKFFRLNGTHLNYILFQGKTLMYITRIVGELKKGIKTKMAAEFNTPLQLESLVEIGNTINTEYLREEIPVGFTEEQVHNLLIVNGSRNSRELLTMIITSELTKKDIPCLIFDMSGKWSSLIDSFKDSRFRNAFLIFRAGTDFSLELLNSGIQYDANNIDYLDLFLDVYAITHKKDERTMDNIKNLILRNPEIDLSTMSIEIDNQKPWENNPVSNSITSLINDFSQDISLLSSASDSSKKIGIKDFICSDKTVIIDLSTLKYETKSRLFVAFTIIAKIIHYSNTFDDYTKKIIILPYVDMLFNTKYLDFRNNVNYAKIDKFLNPLIEKGFGLTFSANQISYLHPNVFNYFNNIVTFKTNNKQDISTIMSYLDLQELEGHGYYSKSRNSTYQIDFIKNLKSDEIVVKRNDVDQPFPIKLKSSSMDLITPMDRDAIVSYMLEQDYDLRYNEKKVFQQTKKTLFEKDLGKYVSFLKIIIKFLKTIQKYENVGNLFESKIKEELKKFLHPKLKTQVKGDKKRLRLLTKQVSDKLFDLLTKHEYLKEGHPTMAGGGQAIRPSFSVGPQYEKALDDYFKTREVDISIDLEEIDIDSKDQEHNKKTELDRELDRELQGKELIDDIEFRTNLMNQTGKILMTNLYELDKNINSNQKEKVFEISENFIKSFLVSLYKAHFDKRTNKKITEKDVDDSIEYLTKHEKIPFKKEELKALINETSKESLTNTFKKPSGLKKLYDVLSEFVLKINVHISKGTLNTNKRNDLTELENGVEDNENEEDFIDFEEF